MGKCRTSKEGRSPEEILKYYYGNNIGLVFNAPLAANIESYPGFPLQVGSAGDFVITIKRQLNRIRNNYPAIPLNDDTEFFTIETENSVRKFQEIFNLDVTGIVDKATWYKIKYIYNSVKKISNLFSEGISAEEATMLYGNELEYLDTGPYIRVLHYLLDTIAFFDQDIPLLKTGTVYDNNTVTMVEAFQKKYGLPVTGKVNRETWAELKNVYNEIINSIPDEYLEYVDEFYPGRFLSNGVTGDDVKRLQTFLYRICKNKGGIAGVRVTGTYDDLTESSVRQLQNIFGLPVNGVVGPVTWYEIVEYSKN